MIEIQTTANENIMNFFFPQKLAEEKCVDFVDAKSLRKSPLAERIFDLGDIESLCITPDMISVKKKQNAEWSMLKSLILAEIMDYIATGEPVFLEKESINSDDIYKQICALVEARIRPAIQKDGGDITVENFVNGVVYVNLSGNCSGCPYAMVTLKEGVEKILKMYIPQVKEVRHSDGNV